jgi:hypothetical protein
MWRVTIIAALMAGPALASTPSREAAYSLADMIASEKACGMSFDQEAVKAWAEKAIAAEEPSMSVAMGFYLDGMRGRVERMQGSEKTVHCQRIERLARQRQFIKAR